MENRKNQLLNNVFDYLNTHVEYAVLRNYEWLPEINNSRDIDIIITKSELKKHKDYIIRVIIDSGYRIVTCLHSDRLITYVCGKIDDKADVTDVIQFDFFVNTSVFGILLLDAKDFLKDRQFNGMVYHVNKDYEFLDKYLYNRATGTAYPEKYKQVKDISGHSPTVVATLQTVFDTQSVEETDEASGKRLLANVIKHNLKRRPLGLICDVIYFLYTFIGNYIRSNTGFSIGFTGPDGSGKTTVIDLLIESLGSVFNKAHVLYHHRPTIIPNAGEAAHSSGMKKAVDREYEKPHRGGKTGILSSIMRLFYYTVDYVIGYFIQVKRVKRITRLVFFDRYYTDIIADSRRSRIFLNYKFLYWFGRLFIPSLDYNVLLTADTNVILARKQELDRQGIENINKKLGYLSDKKGYYLVENNGTPDECVAKILRIVFENQHKKNLKRIGK
jgi:thymidylate kinase